jgi:aminomethyltransferase
MIGTTPFHERVDAANATGLWSHWAGKLVVEKYQLSEKAEYFSVRNAVGVFDTSPLYKYRIQGSDAESFLASVLARDVRSCRPGRAQYTLWCDDRGFVLEDGVVLRRTTDDFLLTAARPNLSYLRGLVGYDRVEISDVTDEFGALAVQGPRSRAVLESLAPEVAELGFFHLTDAKIGDTAVTISRTGFTGDLGYEVWVPTADALSVWDAVFEAGAAHGIAPFGQIALLMARIEAGLLLIDVDFESARYAYNDTHKTTPIELGFGWMFRKLDDRAFIGRRAIEREINDGTSRWKTVGLTVDWEEFDRKHTKAGLFPPKDHTPYHEEMMVYDDNRETIGFSKSLMYSPMLQRHIAIAAIRPDLAEIGSEVNLEVTLNHRYEKVRATVTRMPFYNPERKTA